MQVYIKNKQIRMMGEGLGEDGVLHPFMFW